MTERDSLSSLTGRLRQFASERDWDQFHTPIHLSAALSIEAAELQEQFLWNSVEEAAQISPSRREQISHEIGDVLLYLVRLADKVGVDPVAAAHAKLALNAEKYPIEKARGNHKKYTEF